MTIASPAALANLKATYAIWNETKGEHPSAKEAWLSLFADNFHITSMDDNAPGLMFAQARNSKQEALDYLMILLSEWSMIDWRPETYVCQDDKIAVFSTCSWKHKGTGKTATVRSAHLTGR